MKHFVRLFLAIACWIPAAQAAGGPTPGTPAIRVEFNDPMVINGTPNVRIWGQFGGPPGPVPGPSAGDPSRTPWKVPDWVAPSGPFFAPTGSEEFRKNFRDTMLETHLAGMNDATRKRWNELEKWIENNGGMEKGAAELARKRDAADAVRMNSAVASQLKAAIALAAPPGLSLVHPDDVEKAKAAARTQAAKAFSGDLLGYVEQIESNFFSDPDAVSERERNIAAYLRKEAERLATNRSGVLRILPDAPPMGEYTSTKQSARQNALRYAHNRLLLTRQLFEGVHRNQCGATPDSAECKQLAQKLTAARTRLSEMEAGILITERIEEGFGSDEIIRTFRSLGDFSVGLWTGFQNGADGLRYALESIVDPIRQRRMVDAVGALLHTEIPVVGDALCRSVANAVKKGYKTLRYGTAAERGEFVGEFAFNTVLGWETKVLTKPFTEAAKRFIARAFEIGVARESLSLAAAGDKIPTRALDKLQDLARSAPAAAEKMAASPAAIEALADVTGGSALSESSLAVASAARFQAATLKFVEKSPEVAAQIYRKHGHQALAGIAAIEETLPGNLAKAIKKETLEHFAKVAAVMVDSVPEFITSSARGDAEEALVTLTKFASEQSIRTEGTIAYVLRHAANGKEIGRSGFYSTKQFPKIAEVHYALERDVAQLVMAPNWENAMKSVSATRATIKYGRTRSGIAFENTKHTVFNPPAAAWDANRGASFRFASPGVEAQHVVLGDGAAAIKVAKRESRIPVTSDNFVSDTRSIIVGNRVLDLTSEQVVRVLKDVAGISPEMLSLKENYSWSQIVGDIAYRYGFDAVVYESAREEGFKIAAIFRRVKR